MSIILNQMINKFLFYKSTKTTSNAFGRMLVACFFIMFCTAYTYSQIYPWGRDKPPYNPDAQPDVPEWTKDAVWYHIYTPWFRNGDPDNDPTVDDLEGTWPFEKPGGWEPFPMTADPYAFQPWEEATGENMYKISHFRRYGGDFQGVIDKLDYLQELGVNGLYFCPIFEAPAIHNYDTRMYHHADRFYGPDPAGYMKLYEKEDPADPTTWVWTEADKLFVKLLDEAHQRGMHVIVDGVFTYVGHTYWDERVKGKYPANVPEYREHLKAVVEKWGDPDGDGDPSDGIDGWRLDIGLTLPDDFIREFRTWVRDVNPEAFMFAESYHDKTPLLNQAAWLQGDMYDAHMNYMFGDAMIKAFVHDEFQISPWELDVILKAIRAEYPLASQFALHNLMGTHDTGRFGSFILRRDRPHYPFQIHYPFGFMYRITGDMPYSYKIQMDHLYNEPTKHTEKKFRPDAHDKQMWKTILTFQFCYLGAPYIFQGDETGVYYGTRIPVLWDDFEYEDRHPNGPDHPVEAKVDQEMLGFYKAIGRLRQENEVLRRGSYRTVCKDDERGLFAFERKLNRQDRICAVFNFNDEPLEVDAIVDYLRPMDPYKIPHGEKPLEWELIFGDTGDLNVIPPKGSRVYRYVFKPENVNKMMIQ